MKFDQQLKIWKDQLNNFHNKDYSIEVYGNPDGHGMNIWITCDGDLFIINYNQLSIFVIKK